MRSCYCVIPKMLMWFFASISQSVHRQMRRLAVLWTGSKTRSHSLVRARQNCQKAYSMQHPVTRHC
jgi:hypothetical protein